MFVVEVAKSHWVKTKESVSNCIYIQQFLSMYSNRFLLFLVNPAVPMPDLDRQGIHRETMNAFNPLECLSH